MDYLDATRAGYDATAAAYADRFHDLLDRRPVERAMLGAFADLVLSSGRRTVADVGCGTGATTALLARLGTAPTGIDRSPNRVDAARRRNPHLPFLTGSMTELDLADESVGGVCAWYSTVHLPEAALPVALAQFHRVLVPGGAVLLAFQVGDGSRRLVEAFGTAVDLEFHRRRPAAVDEALRAAGLIPYSLTVREPDDDIEGDGVATLPQAFLLARKPGSARYAS